MTAVQRLGRNSAGSRRWDPQRVYAMFPRLAERKTNLGTQLSGGEQQMLAMGPRTARLTGGSEACGNRLS